MKRIRCIPCFIALTLLFGCGAGAPSATPAPPATPFMAGTAGAAQTDAAQVLPFRDASLPAEARARDLLGRMTLEEKAAQMVAADIAGASLMAVGKNAPGAVLNGGDSAYADKAPEDWRAMIRRYQDAALACRLPIPLLYGLDAVHGMGGVSGAVVFPHNIGLGAADSPDLMEKMGRAVASDMRAAGVLWDFAPCVAAAHDPRWGRTYESYSSDPALVTRLSLPFSLGMRKGGALPTAKHYLADGGAVWGTSKAQGYAIDQGDAIMGEDTLRALHLPQYKALVDAGVPAVMVSYGSWNGVKMLEDKRLITDILKGELGFAGFVVSDYEALGQLEGASLADKAAAAVNAGVDMFMESGMWAMVIKAIVKGVEDGKIPAERVDDAVLRILRVKFVSGLFEDPHLEAEPAGAFGAEEHRALAAELVSRSLVLLKNERGTLPFKAGQKILVTGPAADDLGAQCGGWTLSWQGWTGDNARTPGTTILEGVKAAAAKAGATILTDGAEAAQADIILLVVGEKPYAEGRGDDMDISLTGKTALEGNAEAMAFARTSGKPVVALIVAGRQVMIADELGSWDAAVMAYMPGTEGEGIAPVLFGDRDFTGKLPMPWYRCAEDIGKPDAATLFPPGFGLAYE